MNKERKVISNNPIVVFGRDVKASELITLFQDFRGDIIINGKLDLDKDISLKSNLYVMGDIEATGAGDIDINGNLFCDGELDCYKIKVQGVLGVKGYLDAMDVEVGENLYCSSNIIISSGCSVMVNGNLICKQIYSFNSSKLSVLGWMKVEEEITIS